MTSDSRMRLSGKVAFPAGGARGQFRSHAMRLTGARAGGTDICALMAGSSVGATEADALRGQR